MKHRCWRSLVVLLTLALGVAACSRAIRSTQTQPISPLQMAEFWVDTPVESRDTLHGPGRADEPPALNSILAFVRDDTTGFSRKVIVKDASGVKWSAKLGPEAQSEIVSSRLVWALGYHQVPAYTVGRWIMKGGELGGTMPAARFRRDDQPGYDAISDWSWHENPFVGTQAYKGLLALMIMLNNSDLKPAQNRIYQVTGPCERTQKIYVVRDLGLSWGEAGISDPRRANIDAFEHQGFIKSVNGDRIEFDQKNLRSELFTQITPDDLRWIGQRMSRLTDQQWRDMFAAAAYEDESVVNRFIAKMKQKINQAINVQPDSAN